MMTYHELVIYMFLVGLVSFVFMRMIMYVTSRLDLSKRSNNFRAVLGLLSLVAVLSVLFGGFAYIVRFYGGALGSYHGLLAVLSLMIAPVIGCVLLGLKKKDESA